MLLLAPAMECIPVTSSDSSKVSSGSIPAKALAIMVLPVPGGPYKHIL